ncbi:MAG: hypothetical protein WCS73_00485 [Lentisphaeria bacterium]
MAQKQFQIWRDDFLRYYNKTSLIMRIVVGAVLSFLVAYYALNYQIKPLQQKQKEIRKKLQNMVIIEDTKLMILDSKNQQRKLQSQLTEVRSANKIIVTNGGGLSRSDIGKTILELRVLFDRNQLKIVLEDRAKPYLPASLKSRRINQINHKQDRRVSLVLPDTIAVESYFFKVLGQYGNIQRFLQDVYHSKQIFRLNNLKMTRSQNQITDQHFQQHMALECSFEIHVPFRKEGTSE